MALFGAAACVRVPGYSLGKELAGRHAGRRAHFTRRRLSAWSILPATLPLYKALVWVSPAHPRLPPVTANGDAVRGVGALRHTYVPVGRFRRPSTRRCRTATPRRQR